MPPELLFPLWRGLSRGLLSTFLAECRTITAAAERWEQQRRMAVRIGDYMNADWDRHEAPLEEDAPRNWQGESGDG